MGWIRGIAAISFIGAGLVATASLQAQGNSLSDATARWRERAESERATLANETFAQSLWQMIDYESNMRQVGNASPTPPLPESLIWIVRARRFARLVEDFRGLDVVAHRKVAHTQLAADLERWTKLREQGNEITGGGIWSGPEYDPETLIHPLTIRIHATVVIAAPTSYTVRVSLDQTNGKYHDPKGGNEINRDLVDLAIVFAQNRPTTRPSD